MEIGPILVFPELAGQGHGLAEQRAGAAVFDIIGAEHRLPDALAGQAQRIIEAINGGHVQHNEQFLFGFGIDATPGKDAVIRIIRLHPLVTVPAAIVHPKAGVIQVELVKVLGKEQHLLVHFIIQEQPIQALGEIPLDELAKLIAHEAELLAGGGHLVAPQQAQIGEFPEIIAGHLVDQAVLAMNHFVVGKGQNEILRESVGHGEGHSVVIVFPVDRVFLHVF